MSTGIGIGGDRLVDIKPAIAGSGSLRCVVSDVTDIDNVVDAGTRGTVIRIKPSPHAPIRNVVGKDDVMDGAAAARSCMKTGAIYVIACCNFPALHTPIARIHPHSV